MIGLYAFVDAPVPALTGARGERIVWAEMAEDLYAAIGEAPPALSAEALRAHEGAVRRIAEACAACLPARFGAAAQDKAELRGYITERFNELREALELVRGREQMTLRVYGAEAGAAGQPDALQPGGPGTRYLERRRQAQRIPELEPLRAATQPWVRAERVDREAHLLASVYHLIDKGNAAAYRAAVESVTALRVAVSGPWPAWSFAPESTR